MLWYECIDMFVYIELLSSIALFNVDA